VLEKFRIKLLCAHKQQNVFIEKMQDTGILTVLAKIFQKWGKEHPWHG